MSKSLNNPLPLRKALLWILLSTIVISGPAFGFFLYNRHLLKMRLSNSNNNIVAIIQTTPEKERLKNFYLAELLNLSLDKPTNLFALDEKKAKNSLLSSSLIATTTLKKIHPGTLHIDYTLRNPIAYLKDYSNTLIDASGVAFPYKPFFTPKRLPEIYIGDESSEFKWGQPIQGLKIKLALHLLEIIENNCTDKNCQLQRIDVSHVLADSLGKQEIIVIFSERKEPLELQNILRLSTNNYRQELSHYLTLREKLKEIVLSKPNTDLTKPIVIDLRIPQLAYITFP